LNPLRERDTFVTRDRWADHFTVEGVRIMGLNATGRTTIQVLDLNDARRLELRAQILKGADSI
jgi:hypothetical protein